MIASRSPARPRRWVPGLPSVLAVPDAGTVVVASVVAFWLVVVVAALPQELVQDSWLALLSGREVAQHGLSHTDSLTVWTSGRPWVDQQWLGQLFFYWLWLLAGMRAVLLTHALVLVATVAVGLRAARSLGASTQSVAVGGVAALTVAPWGMQLRTQGIGELFFVVLVALLATDARSPSRRVYLVLPLLALWANIHGSVVLGAALVALRALTLAFGPNRSRRRALALLGGAGLSTFASPYGLSLAGYYKHMLANPQLHGFIDEWGPSTPSVRTAAFYALAFAAVWLTARHGGRLTPFSRLVLLLTMVSAVTAVRSIVWFGLAALVLLPQLLDPILSRVEFASLGRLVRPLAVTATAAALAATAFALTRSNGWLLQDWPTAQAGQIADLARHTGNGRVFADDRYADWLLWTEPQMRGRVAYDVRFELFTRRQITLLSRFHNRIGDSWRAAADGYPIVVLDPTLQQPVADGLLAHGRYRSVVANAQIVVLRAAG
jgi:hypothetical protein